MFFPFIVDFYPHYLKMFLFKRSRVNIKFFSLKRSKKIILYFIKNGNVYDWQKLPLHIKYNNDVLHEYIPILFKDLMANKSPNYNFYESILENSWLYITQPETLILLESHILKSYSKYKKFYGQCNFLTKIRSRDIYPKNAILILHKINSKNI